jgi:hypothetical protein
MTIKVLEHNGIYTIYRRIVKRSDSGQLYESIKRIDLSLPPLDKSDWPSWATSLTCDQLDGILQVFFDKWNFGNGSSGEGRIYQCLLNERDHRRTSVINDSRIVTAGPGLTVTTNGVGTVTISRDDSHGKL